ncbi:uncharacterized protein CEXT_213411 [Caerostris extrusa]|uniref:Uncharacterized protein n=1 Tax=Caerostris extrusa TaxID=172846 RepID=A0AAV4P2W5_CAEEX|nr:uncharacterized protein CEXT_213411 [Caerostris extrusa]
MEIKSVLLFCLGLAIAHGSPLSGSLCSDLTGTWRNELGSNMTINFLEYLRFAWVGECLACDGVERIYTTWVLRSLQIPRKRWMSTRINQDTFYRVDSDVEQSIVQDSSEAVPNSDVLGNWKSVTGDEVEITRASEKGSMDGLHKCAGSNSRFPVYGRFDGNATYTAFGFASATQNLIKGWAGHVYNPQEPNMPMETSWLSYSFSNQCTNPRKNVKYGMDNYYKTAA